MSGRAGVSYRGGVWQGCASFGFTIAVTEKSSGMENQNAQTGQLSGV